MLSISFTFNTCLEEDSSSLTKYRVVYSLFKNKNREKGKENKKEKKKTLTFLLCETFYFIKQNPKIQNKCLN